MRSFSETVTAYGSVAGNNTSAGVQIAGITSGFLPSGLYQIDVHSKCSAATSPALNDNMELRVDGVSHMRILHINGINTVAYTAKVPQTCYVRLNGNQGISVNYVNNFGAAETQTHDVVLNATKVAD